ncbi:hypothetical protein Pcinc_020992 [Petrolisthes cinctipes]|uniref:Uncharacterized protein n=1 Tax=Petrolisthes cinctipes TaxID=88211 RepID=A0AAE1KFN8_PETCI|nr:hypothetical protein Pcinc_020992 [Petrolisthes cinctipes]
MGGVGQRRGRSEFNVPTELTITLKIQIQCRYASLFLWTGPLTLSPLHRPHFVLPLSPTLASLSLPLTRPLSVLFWVTHKRKHQNAPSRPPRCRVTDSGLGGLGGLGWVGYSRSRRCCCPPLPTARTPPPAPIL